MLFNQIRENQKTAERLCRSVASGAISHAYVLEGDASGNKEEIAEAFVAAVLCPQTSEQGQACGVCPSCRKISHHSHEDVVWIQAEGGSIKDEAIEALQARLKKKPYVGDRTAVIIKQADTMTLRAQNRLLKTLEEPTVGTVILLLSENIRQLAPTVLSRCVVFRLTQTGASEAASPEEALMAAEMEKAAIEVADLVLSKAPFYQVAEQLKEPAADRERALLFLDDLERLYRDLILSAYNIQGLTGGSRGLTDGPAGLDVSSGSLANQAAEGRLDSLRQKSRLCGQSFLNQAVEVVEEARRALNRNLNTGYTLKAMILKGERK